MVLMVLRVQWAGMSFPVLHKSSFVLSWDRGAPGTGALVMIFIVLELWPSLEKSRLWAKEELCRAGHLPPHLRLLQFQPLREKPGTNREQ